METTVAFHDPIFWRAEWLALHGDLEAYRCLDNGQSETFQYWTHNGALMIPKHTPLSWPKLSKPFSFRGGLFRGFQEFLNFPDTVSHARFHRGGNSKSLVDPAEVVPRKVEGEHGVKLLPLFRERIGQPGESAHLHSHGQVLALDMGCADLGRVRATEHGNLLAPDTLSRAVARLALGGGGVELHQLGKVHALRPQAQYNGITVRREAVRGHLEAALSGRSESLCERHRVALGAASKMPCENQLAMALNRDKRPGIADCGFIPALCRFGLFLHAYVTPQLIALYVFDPQTLNAIRHEALALLASQTQKVQDRPGMDASNTGSGADAATLYQVLQDADGLLFGQDHVTEGLWLLLYERLLALGAAISLLALAVFPESLGWRVAGWAVHFVSPIEQHKNIESRKHCQEKSYVFREKIRIPSPRPFPLPKPLEKKRPVTVAAGFRCNEGIVLCADTEESLGDIKQWRSKVLTSVYPGHGHIVAFVGAGWSDYIETAIQKAGEGLADCKNMAEIKDHLQRKLIGFFSEHLAHWAYYPEAERPSVELLIAATTKEERSELFYYGGTAFYSTSQKVVGTGAILGGDVLSEYQTYHESLDELCSLAVLVLSKIKKRVIGCGGETHLVALRKGDFAIAGGADVQRLETEIARKMGKLRTKQGELVKSFKRLNLRWLKDRKNSK